MSGRGRLARDRFLSLRFQPVDNMIGRRAGVPADADQWGWVVGFFI
jgi:hypothetical protein